MLTVICGNDRDRCLDYLKQHIPSPVERYDAGELSANQLAEIISDTGGLFNEKKNILIRDAFDQPDLLETIYQEAAASPHQITLLEQKLTKPVEKKLLKANAIIHRFDLPKSQEEFSVFKLTDSIANRDKKNAWLLYQQALHSGKVAEELHGLIWWQIKILVLVARSGSSSTGLKLFVHNKTKSALSQWNKQDLMQKSFELIDMYHQARRTTIPLEQSLEDWILK